MNKYLIVGGGIAGLTVARILKERGIPFTGIEKDERLGGRADVGHHRLYSDRSVQTLSRFCPSNDWIRIDEDAKERRKGEWVALQDKGTQAESFYLHPSFYSTKSPFQKLVQDLAEPVKGDFHTRSAVEKIFPESKTLQCQDGKTYEYENLIWCTDLQLLTKVWQGDNSALLKSMKKMESAGCGLNLDYEVTEPVFGNKNSVVFPFRFKDNKMRAIGISEPHSLNWILFLEDEIAEDREEVAKCVRTLKREILKEFPNLKGHITKEKIAFLPNLSGDHASHFKSLEMVPHLFYIGPQAALEISEPTLMNMDRTLENVRQFEEAFLSQ